MDVFERGANVNATSSEASISRTPLHVAARNPESMNILKELLGVGANLVLCR